MNQRMEELANIAGQSFDVCVIGSGVMAAASALEAQLRGLRTVLLESRDFQAPTSRAWVSLSRSEDAKSAISISLDGEDEQDFRFALSLLHHFANCGGRVLNYARVVDFRLSLNGTISGVVIKDQLADRRFALNANAVLNATQPSSQRIHHLPKLFHHRRALRRKYLHLLLPLDFAPSKEWFAEDVTGEGHMLLVTPWCGRLLVCLPTDDDESDENGLLTHKDVEYVLGHANKLLTRPAQGNDVLSGFVIPRLLFSVRRSHEYPIPLIDIASSSLINLIMPAASVHDVEVTRIVDIVQRVAEAAGGGRETAAPATSREQKMIAEIESEVVESSALSQETSRRLSRRFGSAAKALLGMVMSDPGLGVRIIRGHPAIKAEVVYAVRHEMANCIEDVLFRRIALELFSWRSAILAAPITGVIMAKELNWSTSDTRVAVRNYISRIERLIDGARSTV